MVRITLIALLLMTLVSGQGLAYAQPCDMSHEVQMMMHDEMAQTDNSPDMECCNSDCSCPMATGSVIALTHSGEPILMMANGTQSIAYLFSVREFDLASSFKPPIHA